VLKYTRRKSTFNYTADVGNMCKISSGRSHSSRLSGTRGKPTGYVRGSNDRGKPIQLRGYAPRIGKFFARVMVHVQLPVLPGFPVPSQC